ncbi:hypothetical protein KFK09_007832 [Dendrobium nobile]|uniref:Uncharacterized protein n=1 Tax=Dendrobium nobile TaxID=94219 RepID=A0A8T3BV71_DENNO|nr:hypothetical protein KFK09_007832 [Dendrobium nobile]
MFAMIEVDAICKKNELKLLHIIFLSVFHENFLQVYIFMILSPGKSFSSNQLLLSFWNSLNENSPNFDPLIKANLSTLNMVFFPPMLNIMEYSLFSSSSFIIFDNDC